MESPRREVWRELLDRFPAEPVETGLGRHSVRRAGSGPDIVLLHGIGSGSGSWVHQLAGLSDRYRVTAWDAPGYGESDPIGARPLDADAYADRLDALLEALGVARCVLVGLSLGALIAGRFAIRYGGRVRGLVLADPAAGYGRDSEAERERKFEARIGPFRAEGAERYAAERAANLLAPAAGAERLGLVRWNMARLNERGLEDAARLLGGGDLLADVARFQGEAIVLCGAEDRVTPPAASRAVAEAFSGGRPYHEIPDAGHASNIDAPAAFNRHLAEFERSLP